MEEAGERQRSIGDSGRKTPGARTDPRPPAPWTSPPCNGAWPGGLAARVAAAARSGGASERSDVQGEARIATAARPEQRARPPQGGRGPLPQLPLGGAPRRDLPAPHSLLQLPRHQPRRQGLQEAAVVRRHGGANQERWPVRPPTAWPKPWDTAWRERSHPSAAFAWNP